MTRSKTVTQNEALDPLWQTIPRCNRYSIDGKRYVLVWTDGHGHLVPLAEYPDLRKNLSMAQL